VNPSSDLGDAVRAHVAAHGPLASITTDVVGVKRDGIVFWTVVSRLVALNGASLDLTWREFLSRPEAVTCARTRSKQIRKIITHRPR